MMLAALEMSALAGGMLTKGECIGAVFGLSAAFLISGVVTFGAGWVVAGAYMPVAAGLCGFAA